MAFSKTRTFGVEIELFNVSRPRLVAAMNAAGFPCFDATYTHAVTSAWKVVNDSSVKGTGGRSGREVKGCELVSPILKGEEGLKTLAAVFALLKTLRAKVNHTCGFHVHVGAEDFDLGAFKALSQVWMKYEGAIDEMLADTRKGNANNYCKTNRWEQTAVLLKKLDGCQSIDAVAAIVNRSVSTHSNTCRYYKLNLTCWWRQRTIEVRAKEGTMNAAEAVNWVRMAVSLVDGAATRKGEFWNRPVTATGADKIGRFFSCYVNDAKSAAHFCAAVA